MEGNDQITAGGLMLEELIGFALTLQRKIFPPLLAASGVTFAVGLIGLLLLQRDIKEGEQVLREISTKPLNQARTERYRKVTTACFALYTGMALASAVAVTQTAAAIQYTTEVVPSLDASTTAPSEQDGIFGPGPEPSDNFKVDRGVPAQALHWLVLVVLGGFTVSMLALFNEPFSGIIHRNPYFKPNPKKKDTSLDILPQPPLDAPPSMGVPLPMGGPPPMGGPYQQPHGPMGPPGPW